MTVKRNSFMGISSGTGITSASQTGGASGDQFDGLSLGAGCSLSVNTSADVTVAYDRGLICETAGQASVEAMPYWSIPATTSDWGRFYFRSHTANPASQVRLFRAFSGSTQRFEFRYHTDSTLVVVEYVSGSFLIQSTALAFNTEYRVEWHADLDADGWTLGVYPGEATTGALGTTTFPATPNIAGSWDQVRFGQAHGGTPVTWDVNMGAVAWSNEGPIGPAVAGAYTPFTVRGQVNL